MGRTVNGRQRILTAFFAVLGALIDADFVAKRLVLIHLIND